MHLIFQRMRYAPIAKCAAITSLLVLDTLLGSHSAASATKSLKLGNSWEFLLQGNPSTGYKWVLDEAKSTGLDFVKIESLGYHPEARNGKPLLGAPEPFAFRLTCVKAGTADLIFDYVGPSGSIAQNHEAWVRCS